MKILVVGAGYVGLTMSVCLGERGNKIICIDKDKSKIEKISKGISTIYEKGLEKLLQKNLKNQNIIFKNHINNIPKDVEAIFICVATPEKPSGDVELKYVYDAIEELIEKITNKCIIVIKSTVPIGECSRIERFIRDKTNLNIEVVSNPEFLSQGNAVEDTLYKQRIIIGAKTKYALNLMNKIYKDFKQEKLITTRENAEMIKYVSNSFLALKLSYINSIANLCEKVGTNIQIVAKGIGMDDRIGSKFLNAGIGYGGSCFPKDTKALLKLSEKYNVKLELIEDTIKINERQNILLIEKARKYFKSFKGLNIAVLGLTFKPNTNDLREAPSLKNIEILKKEGAIITIYDPVIKKTDINLSNNITLENNIEDTIKNKDACFIFTEWDNIKKIDINKYKELMKKPIIFDGRNCYDILKMKEAGIDYLSIGR